MHHSPRIRGDGPSLVELIKGALEFSPYSRGWSGRRLMYPSPAPILPVFAGMVPEPPIFDFMDENSPRIRGDGPNRSNLDSSGRGFSPYSRGWSLTLKTTEWDGLILPVFAGMVPRRRSATPGKPYFPRIRGDGPTSCPTQPPTTVLSPYSRGWSSITPTKRRGDHIFPVFAGMVRHPGY